MARNRLAAAAGVALFLVAVHGFAPDPARREAWSYLVVLPLGYGHLIGGALTTWRRRPARRTAAFSGRAFGALGVLCLFAAYTRLLHTSDLRLWLVTPLLLVSAWHIVENDLALARAYRGGLVLAPVRWTIAEVACVAAATFLIGLVALGTASGRQWSFLTCGRALPPLHALRLAEVATAVLLYHALSFLVFSWERARLCGKREGARLRRLLIGCHAVPLFANALLYFWLDALHALVASPALYLFWSVLHAFDTAARRRGRGRVARARGVA